MDKVDVNGKNAAPIFNYLKEEQPGFLTSSVKCKSGREGGREGGRGLAHLFPLLYFQTQAIQ